MKTKELNASELLEEFTFSVEEVGLDEEDMQDNWRSTSTKYMCTLQRGNNKEFITPFYMGSALYNEPTLKDILYAFFMDNTRGMDLYEFAREFGYEMYSAEEYERVNNIYNSCNKETEYLNETFTTRELEVLEEYFSNY